MRRLISWNLRTPCLNSVRALTAVDNQALRKVDKMLHHQNVSLRIGLLTPMLLLAMSSASVSETRTWTYRPAGGSSVKFDAEYIEVVGVAVLLQASTGERYQPPLADLSPEDIQYVDRMSRAENTELRDWTDAMGNQIQARYAGVAADAVILANREGATFQVPWARLNELQKQYILEVQAAVQKARVAEARAASSYQRLPSGIEVATLNPTEAAGEGDFRRLMFSPSGNLLFSSRFRRNAGDQKRLWNAANVREQAVINAHYSGYGFLFTPGETESWFTGDAYAARYDVNSGKETEGRGGPTEHLLRKAAAGSFYRASFSPNGRILAIGLGSSYGHNEASGRPPIVVLVDTATLQPLEHLMSHRPMGPAADLSFSPDGSTLVGTVGSGDGPVGFYVWNLKTKSHQVFPGRAYFLQLVDRGRLMVLWLRGDKGITVFDTATGQEGPDFRFPTEGTGRELAAAVSPVGRIAAAVYDQGAYLYDWATGDTLATLDHEGSSVQHMEFSSDGKLLATGDKRGRIKLWKLAGLLASANKPRPAATAEASAASLTAERSFDVAPGVKLEMAMVPAGSFMMGNDAGESDQKPVHRVNITKSFYLGKYEVTQEQWQAVMGNNPSDFTGPKNPVDRVSWDGCQVFLRRLNAKVRLEGGKFVLPTEAQWEYACRAGSTTRYCYGDDESSLDAYAWYAANSGRRTHPVGENQPNAWGLYDMHGNVHEWCADWYDREYYATSPADDPTGPSGGDYRVFRSQGCGYGATSCYSARRDRGLSDGNRGGFRVALVLAASSAANAEPRKPADEKPSASAETVRSSMSPTLVVAPDSPSPGAGTQSTQTPIKPAATGDVSSVTKPKPAGQQGMAITASLPGLGRTGSTVGPFAPITADASAPLSTPAKNVLANGQNGNVAAEQGFVSLFDGRSFEGWQGTSQFYRIENGSLVSDFGVEPYEGRGGHLFTKKQYRDFILRLEYNLGPAANSDVLARVPVVARPSDEGLAIQILDDSAAVYADLDSWKLNGAIWATAAPKGGHPKPPGQWNDLELICIGPRVTVTLNGKTVVATDLNDPSDKVHRNHPGVRRTQGHLGFNGSYSRGRVEYRNIRIKELAAADPMDGASQATQRRPSWKSYYDDSANRDAAGYESRAISNARYQAERALRDFRTHQLQSHPYIFQPGNAQSWQRGRLGW